MTDEADRQRDELSKLYTDIAAGLLRDRFEPTSDGPRRAVFTQPTFAPAVQQPITVMVQKIREPPQIPVQWGMGRVRFADGTEAEVLPDGSYQRVQRAVSFGSGGAPPMLDLYSYAGTTQPMLFNTVGPPADSAEVRQLRQRVAQLEAQLVSVRQPPPPIAVISSRRVFAVDDV